MILFVVLSERGAAIEAAPFRIPREMKIVEKNITELKPYENNPRRNDEAVEGVAQSIKQFGFKVPMVIDREDVIVCGHTRYKAAKKLGIKMVPCVIADDLTEEEIKAFRLADNKVTEKAEWDFELLNIELADLEIDMSAFGFDSSIKETILEAEEDNYEEPKELETKTKQGDIWILGRHRLMCGDSTKPEDVKNLMGGVPLTY